MIKSLGEKPTAENVFDLISKSSIYGNLGLFIGSGLPMAVLNKHGVDIALSWGDLIKKCAKSFKVPMTHIKSDGSSYPDMATSLCRKVSAKLSVPYEKAVQLVKQKIADLTCLYPDEQQRKLYHSFFQELDASWIITTNYDTVIESILTGKAHPLSSEDQLVAPKGYIPIYHLHGIRTNPESIIITQEDYITLFRPNQYRLQKLPLILKESLTVFIGYNIGDFNVQTAVDWSTNVFSNKASSYPNGLVQFVYKQGSSKLKTYFVNDIVVVEFGDLKKLLSRLSDIVKNNRRNEKRIVNSLLKANKAFLTPTDDMIKSFVKSPKARAIVVYILLNNGNKFITGFLELLSKACDFMWEESRRPNAFSAYDKHLEVLLDILETIELHNTPPALLEMLVFNLNRISPFIGSKLGESYAAHKTWKGRFKYIPEPTVLEMKKIARSMNFDDLSILLER
ncbi:MAG: SIR2 family protein [Cyclobacteriaceae bacterium]|nr:SIR2 family protein [Cyclobacteriaceae bacterium]